MIFRHIRQKHQTGTHQPLCIGTADRQTKTSDRDPSALIFRHIRQPSDRNITQKPLYLETADRSDRNIRQRHISFYVVTYQTVLIREHISLYARIVTHHCLVQDNPQTHQSSSRNTERMDTSIFV